MKSFKEFLNEATAVAKQYVKGGKLSQEDFDLIKSIDKTPSSKYVDWIAKQVVQGNIDLKKDKADLEKGLNTYNDFINRKIITQTIDTIKTYIDFVKILKDNEGKESKTKTMNQDLFTDELKGFKKGTDYDVVHNDSKSTVYAIYNHKLSCAVGKDSGWCTTMPGSKGHWNTYEKNNTDFLYLIDKQTKSSGHGNKKGSPTPVDYSKQHSLDMFAIHKTGSKITVTDKGDNANRVTWSELKKMYNLSDDIFKGYNKPEKNKIIYNPKTVEEVINNLFALGLIDSEDEVQVL